MNTMSSLQHLFQDYQEWFLTILSSLMCICGCLIIFLDLFIKLFNKKSSFDIKSNQGFVICGFSISTGSLIFTSLYNLLPKAFDYFKQDELIKMATPKLEILVFYFLGVIICISLSELIHKFTSESIVHCNHGGETETGARNHSHSHSHSYSHSHSHSHSNPHLHSDLDIETSSLSHDLTDSRSRSFSYTISSPQSQLNAHTHLHSSSSTNSLNEEQKTRSNGQRSGQTHNHSHSNGHGDFGKNIDEELQIGDESFQLSETSQLLPTRPTIKGDVLKKKSILDFLERFTRNHQCVGIRDENCIGLPCISENLTQKVPYDINNLEFYRDLDPRSSLVAYTSAEQLPLFRVTQNQTIDSNPGNFIISDEPDLNLHSAHSDDHHHNVNTPVTKLLSIGLQTCLALTLHKFPEGFIMYATSKADPKLGVSIFLSLAIHNIIEGFSMTLPLYLALNSRIKAVLIAGTLGGLSQPIGAIFGYYILKGQDLKESDSAYIFGILMAITSGFLTVISLQLFTSAINFGGTTNKVIGWCLFGMFVIMLSSALTDLAF